MAEFTAKDVKALRDATGAGMMDCKKALTECDGDYEKAAKWLREKGIAKAAKNADRENTEGAVAIATDGNRASLVHLKSETDFSAKADDFLALVQSLADAVLATGVDAVGTHAQDIEDLKLAKKENIELGQVALVEAADGNSIDTYLHSQDGRGVNGVIVEGSGVDAEMLHQVALHVAFAKPVSLTRDEIDPDLAAKEREALLDLTKKEGKPEQAWDKIVEGRIGAWFKDQVLLEQGLHGDKVSVQDSLGGGSIAQFVQAFIGV